MNSKCKPRLKTFLVSGLSAALLGVMPDGTMAAGATPAGDWKTYDEESGEAAAIVRIVETDGVLSGVVQKLLPRRGIDPDETCDLCGGARRGRKIEGMTILWGVRRQGEEYGGGEILDPENGRIYRVKLSLTPDDGHLTVKGYIGIPLFGRTQVWTRESN